MTLSGKSALVTGGGTGIGFGIAKALAAEGCNVIIVGRRQAKLDEAVSAIQPVGKIQAYACDVADRNATEDLFKTLDERNVDLDILVNSAGSNIPNRMMSEMEPDQWDEIMKINATTAYNCMYFALPKMRAKKDGLIVNISSISGKRAYALGGVAYCASKFAMSALGIAVANEDNKHGVRVTNIYPGEVDTPILDKRPNPVTDDHRATILQPEDFGPIVVTLASLPKRAHIPEMIVKPTVAEYM